MDPLLDLLLDTRTAKRYRIFFNNIELSDLSKIILEDDRSCIVNFFIKRTLLPSDVVQSIDGIFQVSLDEDGLCNFFKQWRSVK